MTLITQLPAAITGTTGDLLPLAQSDGQTHGATPSQLAVLATGATTAGRLADIAGDVLSARSFGVKADGSTDDTAAVQAAANWCNSTGGAVLFPRGQIVIAGTVTIKSAVRFYGHTATTSTDGGYAQWGTQFWGTGSGTAMFLTPSMTNNAGIVFRDISVTASSTSNYTWVFLATGFSSGYLTRCKFQNNGPSNSNGSVFLKNEAPASSSTGYPPCWINFIDGCIFGAKNGPTLNDQTTDSYFNSFYSTGGYGMTVGGGNNTYTNFMCDNWIGNYGLSIVPAVSGPSGPGWRFIGFNIQNTNGIATSVILGNGVNPAGSNLNVKMLGGVFMNGGSTSQDIYIGNVSAIEITGVDFTTTSAKNIVCAGSCDYIQIIGGRRSGSVTLAGNNSGIISTDSFQFGGGGKFGQPVQTSGRALAYELNDLGGGAQTVTLSQSNVDEVVINGIGPPSSVAVSFNFSPAYDGQEIRVIYFGSPGSSVPFTWSSSPGSFQNAPTSMGGLTSAKFKWFSSNSTWNYFS